MLTLFLIMSYTCCAQVAQGDRIMGWQVDMAENNDYQKAVDFALDGCMETISLAIAWSSVEPTQGQFNRDFITNILDLANYYYSSVGLQVELQIYTMNTVTKELPKDLMNTSFDDPKMIARFKILLDTLFIHVADMELTALNIGNESDGVMGINRGQYLAYKTFLDAVIPHAKKLYKGIHQEELKVGTTFTYHGLTDKNTKSLCQIVNEGLDIVSVTYYPLNNDFTMKNPSVVFPDFNKIVTLYPDQKQPLYFVECGYSSSTTCNSSEEKQSLFWHNIFQAWDDYKDNIEYLMIFKSTDWSQAEVDEFGKYYGITSQGFLEYLRTLGVRTWDGDGRNKLAYNTILCELKSRDWCDAKCTTSSNNVAHKQRAISVFPSPTTNVFQIDIADRDEEEYRLHLISLNGDIVKTMDYYSGGQRINMEGIPKGIYLIQLINNNQNLHYSKIIKL